ncbi:MAG: YchJ family metal-binding protein [Pseudomonadota bacterium]
MSAATCPCGSGHPLADCCRRFHAGDPAPDAESLMRSRYSAYVLGLEDYLRATWHPATCPVALGLDTVPRPQWLGLTVKAHMPLDETHATVEFIARYKLNGRAFRLHETSRFERVDGRWLYVDGEIRE